MTSSSRYRDVFAIGEFRAIFLADVISRISTVLAQLALTVLIYARTQSPLLAAISFAAGFLPHLIAGTLLSALVDRVPARPLLVSCNLLSAAVAAAMALPGTQVSVLLVLAFGLGMIRPVFLGARAATLPAVLSGGAYVPGRSLIRLVSQAAQVGGFALGGTMLTVVTPRMLLVNDSICFLLSALLLRLGTRQRAAVPAETSRPSLLMDSLAGVRDVLSYPPLRRVLIFGWVVPALAVMPEALVVPYVAGKGSGTISVGVLLTAIPLATVIAEVATTWLVDATRQVRIIGATAVLTFLPLLVFALRPSISVAFAVLFVSGLGAAFHLGLDRVLLDVAPEQLLARALSIQAAGLMFWQGIAYTIAGGAAEFVHPAIVITVAAGCGLISVAIYQRATRPAQRLTEVLPR